MSVERDRNLDSFWQQRGAKLLLGHVFQRRHLPMAHPVVERKKIGVVDVEKERLEKQCGVKVSSAYE
jgi:hypothetical protein